MRVQGLGDEDHSDVEYIFSSCGVLSITAETTNDVVAN